MIDLMTDEVDDMNQFLLGIPHLESETVDVPDDKESKEKDDFPTLPTKEPSEDQQSATTAALKPSSTEDAKSKTDDKSTDPKSTDPKATDPKSSVKAQRWNSYSHIAN